MSKAKLSLKALARLPVILAVVGAYFNTAALLAEFQTDGMKWVAYIAAASIGIGLFLCVEAMIKGGGWPVFAGLAFFGMAEIAGQILHAALVRADVVVMTDTLRWIMGYVSPSTVVIAGVVMALVAQYGFPDQVDPQDRPLRLSDLAQLRPVQQIALPTQMAAPNGRAAPAASKSDSQLAAAALGNQNAEQMLSSVRRPRTADDGGQAEDIL